VFSININIAELSIFLSILLRLSIVLFMLPIFSTPELPPVVKALAAVAFSAVLFPIVRRSIQPFPLELAAFASVITGEMIYGILFALSMLVIFSAFELAGEVMGFEMGFGFAQVADPQSGTRFSVLAVWAQLLATMIFLSVNGHHVILKILVESFKLVPIGSFTIDSGIFARMITISGTLFKLAMQLAAPVLAVLILTQIGFGLMSKFAPQVNILATSFPLTITMGLLFFGITTVFWGEVGIESFTRLFHFLVNFTK
jgi:flagellar biosynthetic protein FliR